MRYFIKNKVLERKLVGGLRFLKVFRQRSVITNSLRTAGLRMAQYKKPTNNNVPLCFKNKRLYYIIEPLELFFTEKHLSQYLRALTNVDAKTD